MTNELISVIIPAYNSEKYILKCLESVFNQTYKNKEIIVVDDGSTDKTVEIVKHLTEIKLILANHGGSSAARNIGIDNAKGKWVVFIDSDDYIDKDYLSTLISHSTGRDDELVMCSFRYSDGRNDEVYSYMEMNDKETIFSEYLRYNICNKSVDKLYPMAILKEVKYPEGLDLLEDVCFTAHVLEKCERLVRLPYIGYYYLKHENSLSSLKKNQHLISSARSNILEKYVVLSRNVVEGDHDLLIGEIIYHLKLCLNVVKDISLYQIFEKAKVLLNFVKTNANNKKEIYFGCYLADCKSKKEMRRRYTRYVLFHESFKNKYTYIKSSIRRIFCK